jgi:REP element-mobilizing transposase RayT
MREELHAYMIGILRNLECKPFQVGGVEDHVHVLIQLSRKHSAAFVVEKLKSGSTNWINGKWKDRNHFAWQAGYGAFGVGPGGVGPVIKYIQNQEEHHKTISFKEEFLQLLIENGIEFDERYLWD